MIVSGAEYVIYKLGGLTKAAKLIRKPITTVQSWKARTQIPQKHWDAIITAAKSIDIDLTYLDFCEPHTIDTSHSENTSYGRPVQS